MGVSDMATREIPMAMLETPVGFRTQDVAGRSIFEPVDPIMPHVAERSVETVVSSAQELVRRAVNPIRGSFEAAASSAPHTGLPPVWWPPFRIYYPAGASAGAPLLEGPFPLVIFAHGQRDPGSEGDPSNPNPSQDYKRWGSVLHLLARTGIVVVSIQMTGALGSDTVEEAARRIKTVERWMYHRWEHSDMLLSWVTDGQTRDHRHRPLGLIGHSWGIEGCARIARERDFVEALAGVAATWSANITLQDIAEAGVPSLFIAGTKDSLANPNSQPYFSVDPPRHLAAVQAADHWDWFDDDGLTPPPDHGETRCQAGYRIARELLAVFLHRYLDHRPESVRRSAGVLPPSLLTARQLLWIWVPDTAGRPSLDLSSPCALQVDWDVNEEKFWEEPVDATGSETLPGLWT